MVKCRPLLVSPLEAMRNALGAANVEYAVGCNVTNGEFVSLVLLVSLVVPCRRELTDYHLLVTCAVLCDGVCFQ